MRTARPFLIAGIALGLCACATVDMSAMGAAPGPKAAATASGPNVIEKATAKLFAMFSSKGWSTHSSRKRMQSAASLLLNGFEDKSLSTEPSRYAAIDPQMFADDVRVANQHISDTVDAAEIFLATADAGEDVRDELGDLEQALLASRQAQAVFAKTGAAFGDTPQLARLAVNVDRLRDVTDEFGRRVRRAQNRNVASMSGDRVVF